MGFRRRIQTITNDSDRNRRINQSPISFLLCTEMRFGEFLKTVNHQLSASSVCFLENAGFLDIDSVSYYCDYKTIQGSHSELIACEPDVFINSREREDLSSKLLIIANKKTKSFVSVSLYSKEKGIESAPLRNTCHGVIDLSDNGERWEGDILDGYPCGWGRFFNADNMLCYEGFRYKEYTVCYGTGYFPDVFPETKEYCGMISFGLRCGKGTQYNRTGAAIYTGYWMSNKRLADNTVVVPPNTATQLFHNSLMNGFVVQEHSYPHLRAFSLSHYPFLETVEIASYCFYNEDVMPPVTHAPFALSCCEALREVSIDGFSFSVFSSFSLTSLPSLRRLRVAATQSFAFPLCRVFRLESLPALTDVCIGSSCFQKAQSVVFRGGLVCFLSA